MSKFIFENKDNLKFHELCGADMRAVAATINTPECESLDVAGWCPTDNEVFTVGVIGVNSIYRVLAKPYTLEDARKKINSTAIHIDDGVFSGYAVHINDVNDVLEKLAKSLGGES